MADPWDSFPRVEQAPAGAWDAFPRVGEVMPPAPQPAAKPGMGETLARGVARGLTLGLNDEAYGLTQGVASMLRGEGFGTGYDRAVEEYRARDKAASDANPVTAVAGEVVGSIPGVVALGATRLGAQALGLTGRNLVTRSAASAASGAGIGAVQGFNNGEGGGDDRLSAAGAPLATGAAIGLVAPAAGIAIGKGVNAATRALTGRTAVPPGMTAAAMDALADDAAASGGTAAIRQRMADLGPDAMLLDASPSFLGRAQGLAVEPATRETVMAPVIARNQGANARLAADVDGALGSAPVPSRIEAGLEAGRQALGDDYARVFRGARAVDTTHLANTLETMSVDLRGPAQRAVMQVRQMLNIPGNGMQLDPSPSALHQVRQAIDGMMEGEQNSKVLNALGFARQAVDDYLRGAVPGIKEVDARFAELSRQSGGLQRGPQLIDSGRTSPRPAEVADEFASAMQPEGMLIGPSGTAHRMREGLRAEIDRQVGTKANDLVALRNMIKGDGDWNRDRLAIVFGRDRADQIIQSVDREVAFRQAFDDITRNSQTSMREASRQAVRVPDGREPQGSIADIGTVVSGAAGGPAGVAGSLALRGTRLAAAQAEKAAALARNQNIAHALVKMRGPALDKLIDDIERRIGVQSLGATAEDRARDLSQILIEAQGYQGSRALPEGWRQSK